MKAMILAAGLGTRLRPLTFTMPKPMVPVLNRPLIGWAIEQFVDLGVEEIVINLHHLPHPLERYVRTTYGTQASFYFSLEKEILGTSGGIRRVRPQLESADAFFLVNGDTIQFPPYEELRASLATRHALAALTLRNPPGNDRFTPVWFDHGTISGFGEGTGEALMFAGSHLISSKVLDLIPEKEFSGIVDEVYIPAIANGGVISAVVDDGPWFDVGTPKRLIDASRALLDRAVRGQLSLPHGSEVHGTSVIERSARLSKATLHDSTVGRNSVISGTIRDSAVWDRCLIPDGCVIESSIIAHEVHLAEGTELRNVLVCADDPAIPAEFPRQDGNVIVPIA